MSTRDDILARIRANQPAATPLPDVPTFDTASELSLVARFKAGVTRMGGKVIEAGGPPDELVRELHHGAKVVVSATAEVSGSRTLEAKISPQSLEDVDVGVVRARFGVAETGSVWLTDSDFRVSALGFLAQHLVVLLDPAAIVPNMHHAYRRRREFDAAYGVFMTGPSATADIEGVLIHGAQGIRSLTVVLRSPPGA
jgi:L-lactate dehydrogenase complex protein LldG